MIIHHKPAPLPKIRPVPVFKWAVLGLLPLLWFLMGWEEDGEGISLLLLVFGSWAVPVLYS